MKPTADPVSLHTDMDTPASYLREMSMNVYTLDASQLARSLGLSPGGGANTADTL
jgi:hypothetical protein